MNKNKKKIKKRYIFLGIFLVLFIIVRVFMYFGGFSTGKNIDPQEFLKYSQDIENINIPENVNINITRRSYTWKCRISRT